MAEHATAGVALEAVTKRYAELAAVDDVSLEVAAAVNKTYGTV